MKFNVPNFLLLFSFTQFSFFKRTFCNLLNYENIQLDRLISNLPDFCQIKLSIISIESQNLQESLSPLEIIKLPVVNQSLWSNRDSLSRIFVFLPVARNKSVCRINIHYLKSRKRFQVEHFEDLNHHSIPNSIIILGRTYFHGIFETVSIKLFYHFYNIIITNRSAIDLTKSHENSTSNMTSNNAGSLQLSIRAARILRILHEYSVFSFSPKLIYCVIRDSEEKINIHKCCKNVSDFYSHLPQGNSSEIKHWRVLMSEAYEIREYKWNWVIYYHATEMTTDAVVDYNPFTSENAAQTIAHEIIRQTNGTVKNDTYDWSKCTHCGKILVDSPLVDLTIDFITTSEPIKLLTCYYKKNLSFKVYTFPFDKYGWVLMFLTGVILCCIFHGLNTYTSSHDKIAYSFSPFLIILGSLIDEAYPVPQQIVRLHQYKYIMCVWLFATIILSSCYNSLLVVQLNAPLKGKPLESVDEVFCPIPSHILANNKNANVDVNSPSNISQYLLDYWMNVTRYNYRSGKFQDSSEIRQAYLNLKAAEECFAILTIPDPYTKAGTFGLHWDELFPLRSLIETISVEDKNETISSIRSNPVKQRDFNFIQGYFSPLSRHLFMVDDPRKASEVDPKLLTYISSNKTLLSGQTSLEWELTGNRFSKVAVVGILSNLINEIKYMEDNYASYRNCYILPETLASFKYGWAISSNYKTKLFVYLKQLTESGVYSIAVGNEKYRRMLKRREGTNLILQSKREISGGSNRVQPISIDGSIQTIFLIWIFCLAVAVLALAVEVIQNIEGLSSSLVRIRVYFGNFESVASD